MFIKTSSVAFIFRLFRLSSMFVCLSLEWLYLYVCISFGWSRRLPIWKRSSGHVMRIWRVVGKKASLNIFLWVDLRLIRKLDNNFICNYKLGHSYTYSRGLSLLLLPCFSLLTILVISAHCVCVSAIYNASLSTWGDYTNFF